MKYLLIAVLIFVVGCSNLEEKVFDQYVSEKTGYKYDVKIKYINNKLNYVFNVDGGNCKTKFDGFIIEFADKDNYEIQRVRISKSNLTKKTRFCEYQYKDAFSMKANSYRKIKKVNFYIGTND
tara:strand:- start:270 stop:638 length:369 start_codon:yes stop_codon:yes gene_type:complete